MFMQNKNKAELFMERNGRKHFRGFRTNSFRLKILLTYDRCWSPSPVRGWITKNNRSLTTSGSDSSCFAAAVVPALGGIYRSGYRVVLDRIWSQSGFDADQAGWGWLVDCYFRRRHSSSQMIDQSCCCLDCESIQNASSYY